MKKNKRTKTNKRNFNNAWGVGAAVAALAAGAFFSYRQKSWPFNAGGGQANGGSAPGAAQPAANVDIALTNEVASHTEHNPNNAADFTDDGATGNAD